MSSGIPENDSDKVMRHLEELMLCLDQGFQGQAWSRMESVNEEVLLLLQQLDEKQRHNPQMEKCLQRIQTKFNGWIAACTEYRAQYISELQNQKQIEQGVRSYQSTNNM